MIIVFAHPRDTAACGWVERFRSLDARLLTPRDLSRCGWSLHVGEPGEAWAVAEGVRLRVSDVRAVITRVPNIEPAELGHIVEADRAYVATEMTAFLGAWLARLSCPLFNRPSAVSLMGPSLSVERWRMLACRAGLQALVRSPEVPPFTAAVTVVGERWFGAVPRELGEQALCLARYLRLELLTVQFESARSDAAFVSAELFTDLANDAIASALQARIAEKARV